MTKRIIAPLLAGTAAWLTMAEAAAQTTPAGTTAGVSITNTAQASYTVNGTAATATSNPATFVVDRKVNLTVVAAQNGNTSVNLGQQDAVTTNAAQLLDTGRVHYWIDAHQARRRRSRRGRTFEATQFVIDHHCLVIRFWRGALRMTLCLGVKSRHCAPSMVAAGVRQRVRGVCRTRLTVVMIKELIFEEAADEGGLAHTAS